MKLVKIDQGNWEQVAELTTNPDGIPTLEEKFVSSVAYSLLQARFEPGWEVRAIYEKETPIGFFMYGGEPDSFEICRFLIHYPYQHRGYGRKALELLLSEIPITPIYISAEPENTVAIRLYEKMGFRNTGKIQEGEVLLVMEQNPYRKENV